MNILYAINSHQPGGAEKHILDLVDQMIQKGHTVHVWCAGGTVAHWYEKAKAKVTIHPVRVTWGVDLDPGYIFRLVWYLRQNHIDVVHAHELRAVGNCLVAAALARTKVRITHIHTPFSEWPISLIKKKLYTFCYARAVKYLADKEIALTLSRKQVKLSEGLMPSKVAVIPNGVAVENYACTPSERSAHRAAILAKYGISNTTFIFGNISRLTQEKGHEYLLKAFNELISQKSVEANNVHLLIGGGGHLADDLSTLVQSMGLAGRVTFTGQFDAADQIKLYHSFDAFVFPTLAEGFGYVLIEALAAKLPIICSDLEVLHEVGQDYVFCYVPPKDYKLLAHAMRELILAKTKSNESHADQYAFVDKTYSLKAFGSAYDVLYATILKAKV